MRIGIIRVAGKIMGYKSPEDGVERAFVAEQRLQSKLTKEQLRFADHALECRARWIHQSAGYGHSSCNINDVSRLPAKSSVPLGCEIPKIVARTIHTLETMKKINNTHRRYVLILNTVSLNRKHNENIVNILKSAGYSTKQYENARNRFASFLNNH